jgi:hypothetical protein
MFALRSFPLMKWMTNLQVQLGNGTSTSIVNTGGNLINSTLHVVEYVPNVNDVGRNTETQILPYHEFSLFTNEVISLPLGNGSDSTKGVPSVLLFHLVVYPKKCTCLYAPTISIM